MTLNNNEYTFAISVPENWSEFDEQREKARELLGYRFTKSEAKAIVNIIESHWPDFAGKDAIVIEVEGYKCLTFITDEFTPIEDEFTPIECADKVFPFEGSRNYLMQFVEKKISFKRW